MIELERLNRRELLAFVATDTYRQMAALPISLHRAISHAHNPRAEDEDVLLIIARENKVMVGYIGVLPDRLHFDDDRTEKGGWLSCLWIDPVQRGKGIAKLLVEAAIESWSQRILVTEFTGPAKRLYDKIGLFEDLQIKLGLRLYLRMDLAKILPPKRPLFQKICPLLKLFDRAVNLIMDIRYLFPPPAIELPFEYVNGIDEEIEALIEDQQQRQLFRRKKPELRWIVEYPWLLSAPDTDFPSEKYAFSSVDRSFNQVMIKVRNVDGRLTGFMMLSRRDRHLKVPYFYAESAAVKDMGRLIARHLKMWKINTFTTYHPSLITYFQEQRAGALFQKSIQRHYIISRIFDHPEKYDRYEIQDGDADCAFT